jgi:OPT family small oligopeptide transporter
MIGYGWAGIFQGYLVKPAHMWWPANLVQVSLFRTMHDKDVRAKGGLTRFQFFLIALTCSYCYYVMPGYLFNMLTSLSWVCWAWPNSVTAQQLGSGMRGLGIGAIALDWSSVSSFLGSPMGTPFFAILNVFLGFALIMYVLTPAFYWGNVYNARKFPIFSSDFFTSTGQTYNVSEVITENFQLDETAYNAYGRLHLSTFFAVTYGVGFAALAATISHVALFHGREIWQRYKNALSEKDDVHTRLMRAYKEVPQAYFVGLLISMIIISIVGCEIFIDQLQLRWWGVLLACGIAFFFTLPLGVICATTNQLPGLNIITELIIGYLYPGRPVANVCFKTYGYISMTQAVSFLMDFKLGHTLILLVCVAFMKNCMYLHLPSMKYQIV